MKFHRLKAIVKLKYDLIFIKTMIYSLVCVNFFKDRCLVYFCSACYKISQFVFSSYYSRMYQLKSVSFLSLRLEHGFLMSKFN